jgi:beta-galactosidase
MKKFSFFKSMLLIFVFIPLISCSLPEKKGGNNRTQSFDENWRFIKDNPLGAEDPAFDDSQWRVVDMPHDWSIEDLPGQDGDSIIGPFTKSSIGKMGTGYTVGGTAWYRKTFVIDRADQDKIAYLRFDGVYMNSDVWINGKHVGNHPYGYTSFYYNITPYLNQAGQTNVVAVQVKNEGRNARWYSGSGIYRHTWLILVDPVHIGMWGTYITTPVVSENSADIEVTTTLLNEGKENTPVTLVLEIVDPTGKPVGKTKDTITLIPGTSNDVKQKITVNSPALWSTDQPDLYQARTSIMVNKKTKDNLITTFGIRTIRIDAETGLTLNGKNIELKGGCFHHDNGPLGSVAIDRAEERKIELLKNAGFNAIRCSHNPPSPCLLDACDRLGMLAIDEFCDMWERPKISPDDYSKYFKTHWRQDISSMVMRDRNHPSVIMWSIGNEIPEAADTSGLRIAKNLASEVRRLDPTRAITEAMVDFESFITGKSGWDKQAPHMDVLDVVGYNYSYNKYEEDHQKYPDRIIMATEFMPPLSFENWQMVEKFPYVIGNFSWTAMDYLGEAGVGVPRLLNIPGKTGASSNPMAQVMQFFNPDSWPIFNDFQGDLDLIGNQKTPYYYQHVVWRENKAEMFVHRPVPAGKMELVSPWGFPDELKSWNWEGHEGEQMQVHVYTRSQLVRLELNGKVIGEQTVDDSKSITATFEVPYEAGTLTARCFDNGTETASTSLITTGKPAAIRLIADRTNIKAGRNDLSYVMAEIIDNAGNVIPNADDILVNFEITGNGVIAGVGNGSPSDMSSFQQPRKRTWQGRCLAVVRPKGTAGRIVLKASADGLQDVKVEIMTENR